MWGAVGTERCAGALRFACCAGCNCRSAFAFVNGLRVDLSLQLSGRSALMPMGCMALGSGWVNHSEWCAAPVSLCISQCADGLLLLPLCIGFGQI